MGGTLHELTPGTEYEILADIVDYHGQSFLAGKRLIYLERHYLPYDDGHTLSFRHEREFMQGSFREVAMYLQGNEHRNIIENLAKYLRPVIKPGSSGRPQPVMAANLCELAGMSG